MTRFNSIFKKVLKESQHDSFSVGNELFNLYTQIDPEAMTKSGAKVVEVLRNILNEFDEIVQQAKENSDNPEAIHNLIKQLEID
mgnify:CR=1 FL=1